MLRLKLSIPSPVVTKRFSWMRWLLFSTMFPLWALRRIHAFPPSHLPRPATTFMLSSRHSGHDPPIQSSPATAMQEGDTARRILKQRSTRGQPGQLLSPDSQPNTVAKKKKGAPKRTRKSQNSKRVSKLARGEGKRRASPPATTAKKEPSGKPKKGKVATVKSKASRTVAIKGSNQMTTFV